MTKDELLKVAKEEFNITLNPKEKLVDLEAKLTSLEANKGVKEVKTKKTKEVVSKDPIASKGEHGKLVAWHPTHRAEFWQFIYDKKHLTDEEVESLGL